MSWAVIQEAPDEETITWSSCQHSSASMDVAYLQSILAEPSENLGIVILELYANLEQGRWNILILLGFPYQTKAFPQPNICNA